MKKTGVILLIIVTIASLTTIVTNYFIIKILSASRAYINGESQYSKGEKEASKHLILYIYSEKPEDYHSFLKAIDIPIGDRHAREALSNNDKAENDHIAKAGFLQARNHPQDIEDMIWLFKTFKHLAVFENAITIWREADMMVAQIQQKGLAIHNRDNLHELNDADKNKLTFDINLISDKLTIKQRAFSEVLGG